MPPPESGSVRICPEGYRVDSLAACVRAALACWGRPVPFHYIHALAGAAFAPRVREGAVCAFCHEDRYGSHRLRFLGHALGFTVDVSPSNRGSARWETFAAAVAEAVGGSEVILCRSWPAWSVLTGWADNPAGWSLASPVESNPAPRPVAGARLCILRQAARTLSRGESYREAIWQAARLDARRDRRSGFRLGFGGYAAWLEQLSDNPYCPQRNHDALGCAARAAERALGSAESAARFLRGESSLSARPRRDVRVAADAYAAVAAELRRWNPEQNLRLDVLRRIADLQARAERNLLWAARTL